jgi:4-diphosphocytidyl-2-C-methyl-D-erythritol kinase
VGAFALNAEAAAGAARYPAPAKLNLFLHITGRRPDGYHLLKSVIRLIDFGDDLWIVPRTDGVIRRAIAVENVPEDSDLCLRAAHLLKERTGSTLGAEIRLEKRIPVGGGLGGGSSDAATVLMVLNDLWKTRVPRAALQGLALELGADVPFFVFGESAFVEGIGERLTPVKLQPAWYLVLTPQVAVATRDVFAAPELKRDTASIEPPRYREGFGCNALEEVVRVRHPQVARHLEWLAAHGDARMTGSGACVFAAFVSEAEANAAHASLAPGMHGFVARGLDRHPLYTLAA